MKLGLSLQTSLQQTLTPQQIQYLKLLQLPLLQMEQHVRTEMENNPMLEDGSEQEYENDDSNNAATDFAMPRQNNSDDRSDGDANSESAQLFKKNEGAGQDSNTSNESSSEFDPKDAFEFYQLIWGEDPSSAKSADNAHATEEEDENIFQFKDVTTLEDDLAEQWRFLSISDEDRIFGEYVIGNVDSDGYLRRDMEELVQEVNAIIAEHNLALQAPGLLGTRTSGFEKDIIPNVSRVLTAITPKQAETVVRKIHNLDPPGFASRSVQECLVAQLRTLPKANAAQKLALLILTDAYDAFAMKHYHIIEKNLEISEDYLREAIEVIRRLNPRPGGGTFGPDVNTVTPDFSVERSEEDDQDFLITVNDSRLPSLKVSTAYDRLKREARYHKFNKETKEWLRKKYEDAKFLIQAIRQRKSTMLKVMTAIAGLQKDFFIHGPQALKPLIYRDVAEITSLDISTICRIVNSKYVLSEWGTFELKYFFSESLITDDGEEVSTRVIKQKIKELIGAESKSKPMSDDKLGKDLKALGYNVARRTVAKYREQLKIPVARLRREL
ncbi:MAG: RNA polymerase factor sigma-54 [Ignavibacteria bacterium]|nr:RNA polymerase factor sigma-54 [Ignavibacteria bacterium]